MQLAKTRRWQWAAVAAVAAACWLLFVHVDVMETANHAYLFLESLFSGRIAHFYTDVMAHENSLYYINNAHYTIVVYAIFAVAELPVFIFNAITGMAVNETVLYFLGKLVSIGFFAACVPVVYALGRELGLNDANRHKAAIAFALWPPAFFATAVMGQYDSLCLLFTLLGVLYWLRGRQVKSSLWFGLGIACKFFPLVIFVPLLALRCKKPLRLLGYLALGLWPTALLSLLYAGRGGDMGFFNGLMLDRLFQSRITASHSLALYPCLLAAFCVVCYFWHPAKQALARTGLWVCLASFGLLFLFVEWHPQWLLLLAPFVVLTTFLEQQKLPFIWMDAGLSACFFILCALKNPGQLEANLLDFGLPGLASGLTTYNAAVYNTVSFYYYTLADIVTQLAFPVFTALLALHIVLKRPAADGTTAASRLWGKNEAPAPERPLLWVALCFAAGMAVWALPTLFTWVKAVL